MTARRSHRDPNSSDNSEKQSPNERVAVRSRCVQKEGQSQSLTPLAVRTGLALSFGSNIYK